MQTVLAVAAVAVGVVLTGVAGLWVYVSATATPLHPNAQSIQSVTGAAPLPKWADAVDRGRQIVRTGLIEQNLPGLSVAVGVGGEIVWAEGFGWADLDTHASITPDTRFRTGDTSKALTSAAVGLLLENNTLKLDDEIHTYVPDYPKKPWPITLRQLMAQTAGLTTDQGDEAWLEPCGRTLDGLKLFAKDELLFEPGTRYEPSSYGWILVSAAVEAAAREPFFSVHARTCVRAAGPGRHEAGLGDGKHPESRDLLLSEVREEIRVTDRNRSAKGTIPATRAAARSCRRRRTWFASGWHQ